MQQLVEEPDTQVGFLVEEVFADESMDGFVDAAFDVLKVQTVDADKQIRRSISFLVAVTLAFELLLAAQVGEVSLLGLKITQPTWLLILLPVLASLLYASALDAVGRYSCYSEVTRALLTARYPLLIRNNLEFFFVPGDGSLIGATEVVDRFRAKTLIGRLNLIFTFVIYGVAVIVPLAYGIAAYARLFDREGLSDLAVAASLAVSLVVVAFGIVRVMALTGLDTSPRDLNVVDADEAAAEASDGASENGTFPPG